MSAVRAACSRIHLAWGAHVGPMRLLYGPSCEHSSDPRAGALREAGVSFDWVACSVADLDAWDLHVGIVLREDGELTGRAGLHVVPGAIAALRYIDSHWERLGTLDLDPTVAAAAGERQWNARWRQASSDAEIDEIVMDALAILACLVPASPPGPEAAHGLPSVAPTNPAAAQPKGVPQPLRGDRIHVDQE